MLEEKQQLLFDAGSLLDDMLDLGNKFENVKRYSPIPQRGVLSAGFRLTTSYKLSAPDANIMNGADFPRGRPNIVIYSSEQFHLSDCTITVDEESETPRISVAGSLSLSLLSSLPNLLSKGTRVTFYEHREVGPKQLSN